MMHQFDHLVNINYIILIFICYIIFIYKLKHIFFLFLYLIDTCYPQFTCHPQLMNLYMELIKSWDDIRQIKEIGVGNIDSRFWSGFKNSINNAERNTAENVNQKIFFIFSDFDVKFE